MQIFKALRAGGLFFVAGCLFSHAALAQELPAPVLDALKRAGIPAASVGVYAQEVNSGKMLALFNSSTPLNPASTMKLVTSNAALELLGPTFTWKTQAYASGTQQGDVLNGDLIIKGSGDPKLVLENFWLFLRQIRAKGIREIRGNVLLDRSAFEEGFYDPASFDGDPVKPYNAGPDALLLNYKAFGFRFVPDVASGHVKILVDPPVAGYPVLAPKLTNGDCGDWKGKLQGSFNGTGTTFGGSYSASCGDRTWYVHPYQMTHAQYFAAVFRQVWTDLGGTLKGDIRNGQAPAGAVLVGEWESTTLPEVIRDINKYSNNVMARQLLLTLAYDIFKLPANPERGARAIKTWLGSKGIDATELVIENGSGLSRVERISANTMGRMLTAAFQSPTMPEFISSMPLVGYDGTMRRRLNTRSVAGNAHIKTGSLNEVRAIAGYVLAASGKRYAVVCIVNHRNAPAAQPAQDALLQWVYEQG
jgi:D-alanyl-D-alanine carboxypeptidase/D-alanyl-D-alanine-endopeptidase (penicillin-binding protein 4)